MSQDACIRMSVSILIPKAFSMRNAMVADDVVRRSVKLVSRADRMSAA